MEKPEHTLEWLGYDGRRHYFASGHFLKFEIRLVEQSGQVLGIAYSFTFHDPDGIRLVGFDNAHPVPHTGGKYVKALSYTRHVDGARVVDRAKAASDQGNEVVVASAVGRRRPGVVQRPSMILRRS
jgi:hypothetical protein